MSIIVIYFNYVMKIMWLVENHIFHFWKYSVCSASMSEYIMNTYLFTIYHQNVIFYI